MTRVWKIAPGRGAEDWPVFREHNCIGLGWLKNSNYRKFSGVDDILAVLEKGRVQDVPGNGVGAARMIWKFVDEVKLHHVIVANDRYNRIVGIGVIASEYLPPSSPKNPIPNGATHRRHVRRVNWIITEPIDLPGKRFFVQSTLSPLASDKIDEIFRVLGVTQWGGVGIPKPRRLAIVAS